MSTARRPTAVRSYVLRPLWWLPFALAFGVLLYVADATTAEAEDDSFDNGYRLTGVVDEDYGGGAEVPLTYDNPLTGETDAKAYRWSDKPAPDPGEQVAIEVDRADPNDVVLEGDRYTTSPLWWVVFPTAVVLVIFAVRLYGVWRTARLMTRRGPSFMMLATVGTSGRSTRWARLHLYPLDAASGSPPLCSVALHSSGGIPVGGPAFVVEVKGKPRPFGRVVARLEDADRVLWPRGRSLTAASNAPLPAERATPPRLQEASAGHGEVRSGSWLRSLAALGALGAASLLGLTVTAKTISGWNDARALNRVGVEVLATVTYSNPDDYSVVAKFQLPGSERSISSRVPVDFPEDWDVDDRFPAIVDPSDPDRIRFLEEPYDALEPILWGWTPAGAALIFLAWTLRWWRLERRAIKGPWFEVDTWWVGEHFAPSQLAEVVAVAVAHPGSSAPSCVVRLPVAWGSWWRRPIASRSVERMAASGILAPGEAVALRHRELIVPALGPARTPGRRLLEQLDDLRTHPTTILAGLRHRRVTSRKLGIEVGDEAVQLFLPSWFGGAPWTLPMGGMVMADLTGGPGLGELRKEAGLSNVRFTYLPTTNHMVDPTLALLFDEPRTVPPLRLLAIGDANRDVGIVASRLRKARVDGVLLRADDPAAAIERLATAGIEQVELRTWIRRRAYGA